jgi:hypothetical protein
MIVYSNVELKLIGLLHGASVKWEIKTDFFFHFFIGHDSIWSILSNNFVPNGFNARRYGFYKGGMFNLELHDDAFLKLLWTIEVSWKSPSLHPVFWPPFTLNPSFSGISKVENMLWIQDIVESTLVLSFFINFKIDMVGFVYPHKVVARRNTFSVFSNT